VGRSKKVRWTGPARADVLAADASIRVHNPAAAARYASDILASIERISRFPGVGARLANIPLEGELRSLVVRNHRVIYKVRAGVVWIMRVWDCRQDPDGLWDFFSPRP
jgi:plasmid stabilization system protein ParE